MYRSLCAHIARLREAEEGEREPGPVFDIQNTFCSCDDFMHEIGARHGISAFCLSVEAFVFQTTNRVYGIGGM